jgi:alpha-tubulin suppressor-like RCC1 family protein
MGNGIIKSHKLRLQKRRESSCERCHVMKFKGCVHYPLPAQVPPPSPAALFSSPPPSAASPPLARLPAKPFPSHLERFIEECDGLFNERWLLNDLFQFFNAPTTISASKHNLVLKHSRLYTWGNNETGQLGRGNVTNAEAHPSAIPLAGTPSEWRMVSAGNFHSFAIDMQEQLWTWGNNESGQLGLGHNMNQSTPQPVLVDNKPFRCAKVSAGGTHSLAIDSQGQPWAWGSNMYGQLGLGHTNSQATPQPVLVNGQPFLCDQVSAGGNHSLASNRQGQLWAWGNNAYAQLGLGHTIKQSTPQRVLVNGHPFRCTQVSAGAIHSLAIDMQGQPWAWGSNEYRQLGLGDNIYQATPQLILVDGHPFLCAQVSAGGYHSLASNRQGQLWAWGSNRLGQLGLGDKETRDIPTLVPLPANTQIRAIAAGGDHSLAIDVKDRVWSAGEKECIGRASTSSDASAAVAPPATAAAASSPALVPSNHFGLVERLA